MSEIRTLLIVLGIIIHGVLFAQEEYLVGEYHFSTGENIASNETQSVLTFESPAVSPGLSTLLENGILNIYQDEGAALPVAWIRLKILPQRGFNVRISKVDIALKITSSDTEKIRYFHNNLNDNLSAAVQIATISAYDLEIASCEQGISLSVADSLVCNDSTGYSLFIKIADTSLFANGNSLGIDFVRFYGPYTDNRVPAIVVPQEEQFIGATISTKPAIKIIEIDYEKLNEDIMISSSSSSFSADFMSIDEGEFDLKKIIVSYLPSTTVAYETADITLNSGEISSVIKVRGWGLPENTIAAWNFEDKTLNPVYKKEGTLPSIGLVGNAEGVYYDKNNLANIRWMYEINNLYTTVDGAEKPEMSGLKINHLENNVDIRLLMDVQWRNSSPSTAKIGAYNEQLNNWGNAVYWKNTRESLGIKSFDGYISLNADALYILSAFDQDIVPKAFKTINPTATLSNTNGWAFDNIIIVADSNATGNNDKINENIIAYANCGQLFIRNILSETQVEIFSTEGILVKRFNIYQDGSFQINLKGIFLIRLSGKEKTFVKKIII